MGWQGLLRRLVAGEQVRRIPPTRTPIVERANDLQISAEDVGRNPADIRSLLGHGQELIVTNGARGAMYLRRESDHWPRRFIPAIPAQQVVDSTGAGDIFLASWIAARVLTTAAGVPRDAPGETGMASRELSVAAVNSSLSIAVRGMTEPANDRGPQGGAGQAARPAGSLSGLRRNDMRRSRGRRRARSASTARSGSPHARARSQTLRRLPARRQAPGDVASNMFAVAGDVQPRDTCARAASGGNLQPRRMRRVAMAEPTKQPRSFCTQPPMQDRAALDAVRPSVHRDAASTTVSASRCRLRRAKPRANPNEVAWMSGRPRIGIGDTVREHRHQSREGLDVLPVVLHDRREQAGCRERR